MTDYVGRLNSLIDDLKKEIIEQEKEQEFADKLIVELKEELEDIRSRYEYVLERR